MEGFSYRELGALLQAVGMVMARDGLCAGAAMDGCSDEDLIHDMMKNGITGERAAYLLSVDLDEAVNYTTPTTAGDRLKAMGYDLDELELDNPYTAWMREGEQE